MCNSSIAMIHDVRGQSFEICGLMKRRERGFIHFHLLVRILMFFGSKIVYSFVKIITIILSCRTQFPSCMIQGYFFRHLPSKAFLLTKPSATMLSRLRAPLCVVLHHITVRKDLLKTKDKYKKICIIINYLIGKYQDLIDKCLKIKATKINTFVFKRIVHHISFTYLRP